MYCAGVKLLWTFACSANSVISPIHRFGSLLCWVFDTIRLAHYNDVKMSAMASQITSPTSVYSTVYSGADQRKHQQLRVTGLCAANSPVAGEFPAQKASNAEKVPIWWRHHGRSVFDEWLMQWIVELSLGLWGPLFESGILQPAAGTRRDVFMSPPCRSNVYKIFKYGGCCSVR